MKRPPVDKQRTGSQQITNRRETYNMQTTDKVWTDTRYQTARQQTNSRQQIKIIQLANNRQTQTADRRHTGSTQQTVSKQTGSRVDCQTDMQEKGRQPTKCSQTIDSRQTGYIRESSHTIRKQTEGKHISDRQ